MQQSLHLEAANARLAALQAITDVALTHLELDALLEANRADAEDRSALGAKYDAAAGEHPRSAAGPMSDRRSGVRVDSRAR